MLIKLPKTGPGVRFLESSCVKAIAVAKQQETVRDPAVFVVQLMDDKQKELASIKCASIESAESLMETIATVCNTPPQNFPGKYREAEKAFQAEAKDYQPCAGMILD